MASSRSPGLQIRMMCRPFRVSQKSWSDPTSPIPRIRREHCGTSLLGLIAVNDPRIQEESRWISWPETGFWQVTASSSGWRATERVT